jgi:hypothetical protein
LKATVSVHSDSLDATDSEKFAENILWKILTNK